MNNVNLNVYFEDLNENAQNRIIQTIADELVKEDEFKNLPDTAKTETLITEEVDHRINCGNCWSNELI